MYGYFFVVSIFKWHICMQSHSYKIISAVLSIFFSCMLFLYVDRFCRPIRLESEAWKKCFFLHTFSCFQHTYSCIDTEWKSSHCGEWDKKVNAKSKQTNKQINKETKWNDICWEFYFTIIWIAICHRFIEHLYKIIILLFYSKLEMEIFCLLSFFALNSNECDNLVSGSNRIVN